MMDDLEYPRLGFIQQAMNGIAAKTEMRPFLNKNETFSDKQGKQGNNEQAGEKPRQA